MESRRIWFQPLFLQSPNKRSFLKGRGYIHGCRVGVHVSKWLIAGCQHKIAINTAAVPEPIQIYTRQPCIFPLPHEVAIYTAVIQEPGRLYTFLPGAYKKSLFTRQPFKSLIGCYTLLPGV